jgi:hypothetical protein
MSGGVFFLGAMPPDPHGSPCGLDFSTTLITSCPCLRLHALLYIRFFLYFFSYKYDRIPEYIIIFTQVPPTGPTEYVCDGKTPHPPACRRHTACITKANRIFSLFNGVKLVKIPILDIILNLVRRGDAPRRRMSTTNLIQALVLPQGINSNEEINQTAIEYYMLNFGPIEGHGYPHRPFS